jgi:hypothetical protein
MKSIYNVFNLQPKMLHPILALFLLCGLSTVSSLDNGLALTPPMGWMHWERFRCIIDCDNYPDDCISEQLFRAMADRLAEDGYLEAGYEYLIIDDCWLATERDSEGRLQPDPDRFPNGIKALADYVHDKGLKFGIYEDYGTNTCGGYPGILGHLETDANTFAEWGVDYLKLDGCYAATEGMEEGYAEMGMYLNQTGRPIVYSCSFPAYKGLDANYTAAVEICNLWRNYGDIQDSWGSVKSIVNWFVDNQGYLSQFAGPGHWNDPDMLIIGDYGLSYDESISQMTMWTMMASPLIMSVDLRTIEPEFRDILLNKDAIRINQDPLGIPGLLAKKINNVYVWTKPILPQVGDKYSYAIGFVSFREDNPIQIEVTLDSFGLDNADGYTLNNVFDPTDPVTVSVTDPITFFIDPSGGVLLEVNPVGSKKFQ